MQQRPGEQARLYITQYEVIHYRANQLTADEQIQNGEMMFFAETLLTPLQKKLLKKMHSNYGPHSLREAFDMTLEFEKEYQITHLQSTFNVMKTYYEETPEQEEFSMGEVQTRLQVQGQGQGQYQQGNCPQYQKRQYNNNGGQKSYQGNNYRTNPN